MATSSSPPDWDAILELAIALAREAGAELRYRFGRQVAITMKGDRDPVSEADYAAETIIREGIQAHYPRHAILGEEQGESLPCGPIRWLIDPLDGTVNYLHRFPHFAVSIGVADAQGVQVGVVYDPLRDELFTARRGVGAFCNGVRCQVSTTADLRQALLATGFPYDRHRRGDNNHREFMMFNLAAQGVRRSGAAALDLAYVACGRLDGYWEQHLGPWDVAAGALLVECAGGKVTTYSGDPFDGLGHQLVASNGHLHAAMLAKLAGVRRRAWASPL
ncbi:MAG: inositol monophosphatase [Candidatus Tectimicrobiota bacterium]|nr:MAG: inositol monophosphatase [Candidatus Tectomicrobia bacterium]